jgi:hypothetical protein
VGSFWGRRQRGQSALATCARSTARRTTAKNTNPTLQVWYAA